MQKELESCLDRLAAKLGDAFLYWMLLIIGLSMLVMPTIAPQLEALEDSMGVVGVFFGLPGVIELFRKGGKEAS